MNTYVIRRRDGWRSPEDLQELRKDRGVSATKRWATTSAGSAAMSSKRRAARSAPSASTRARARRRWSSTRHAPASRRTRPCRASTRSSSGPIPPRLAFPYRKGAEMAKQVNCPCSETVRGESDDELVSNVEAHVQDKHPEMVGTMSREQILGMAEEAA